MKLTKENTTRKIDTLGRVSIPKGMRDRLGLRELNEVEFFLLEDDDGDQYVCLRNVDDKRKYLNAASVLEELGCDIPENLKVHL